MILVFLIFLLNFTKSQTYSAKVLTSPQIIYNWTSQHCPNGIQPYQWDVPDSPIRAFRTLNNQTYFFGSVDLGSRANYINDSQINQYPINHSCNTYYNSTLNYDVSMFADHEWITATYIIPNTSIIYGLLHMEYHGWSDATPKCNKPFPACWYNVITLIKSIDNGLTWFYPVQPPNHLVAALPYQYFYNQPPFGWRSPSNILYYNGYYYATITTFGYGNQTEGTTIMRTDNIEIPNSWKCWNGINFGNNVSTNPYINNIINDNQYLCNIITVVTYPTILWSKYFNKFIMIGTTNGCDTCGYGFMVSDNLVNWSDWYVIRKGYTWNSTYQEIYPSFIDLESDSINFETVGKNGYLYYVVSQGEYGNTLERSIFRQEIEFFID